MAAAAGYLAIPSAHGGRAAKAASRRTFSPEYKLRMLARAREARSQGRGKLQALLREEGLRTSHLSEWRKQLAGGLLGKARRGRPVRDPQALLAEIRLFKHRMRALEKRLLDTEHMLLLQKKYILAATLRRERKDRGLLSELIAQVEGSASISEACRALGVARRDFYRTIKPRRGKTEDREG